MLAQLTQLEHLSLSHTPWFTDAGLEQLTKLDLGHLYVCFSGLSEDIRQDECGKIELKHDSEQVRIMSNMAYMRTLQCVMLPSNSATIFSGR